MHDKIKPVLMIVGVVFLVSLTVLVNVIISNEVKKSDFIGLESEHLRTINVGGEGNVYAVPDAAEISFSVITDDEDSEKALRENNEKAERVVSYLKEQGIQEEDIQTTGIDVRPIYERDEERGAERRISRYEAINKVEVKIEDLEKAETVIGGAVEAGANRVDGFELVVSDEEELKAKAREKAIKEAREKAEQTASSLRVKLGRVIEFSESRSDYIYPVMERGLGEELEEDAVPEVPVEPGENEITVNVSIEYEII